MEKKIEIGLGDKKIGLETGKLAKQADGAVIISMGGTVVLVTAVASKGAKEGSDFFPLTVEYQERTYAAGKIPGGFFKREGKPPESSVLTSRLIDRPIRPLFPDGMMNDVQVIALVLSYDGENEPDILAMNGASAALCISDIPFNGPIASVRIGRINGQFIINPIFSEIAKSDMDIVLVGTKDKILMIEAGASEVEEAEVIKAINFGRSFFDVIIDAQEKFAKECGKTKRTDISFMEIPEKLYEDIKSKNADKIKEIILLGSKEKMNESMDALKAALVEQYISEDGEYKQADISAVLYKLEKAIVRDYMLETGKRVDNRGSDEIRKVTCETGVLPRTHGSCVFTRGQTQALAVATLGTASDEQIIDALSGEAKKAFMLHYNFPPFSVGEAKFLRGPGRREIGHGALAERALAAVMPVKEVFPYTVRLVSDILESNGSSSMATVCGSSLALMDAGVPIKAPVSGIAMGLVIKDDKHMILTDIAGVEDHFGDMDFKVAGTRKGVTAIQLDMKIEGFGMDLLEKAFEQAKGARFRLLDIMEKELSEPRKEMSAYAPRIKSFKIRTDKIKDVIGPGGKMIKKIVADTGVDVNISDDGTVNVATNDSEAMKRALKMINDIVAEAEPGKIYDGIITRIMNFGAFCEYLPGKEGLVHISELSDGFIKNVTDVVKEGDAVKVKCIEVDGQGRVNLSMKQAQQPEETNESE